MYLVDLNQPDDFNLRKRVSDRLGYLSDMCLGMLLTESIRARGPPRGAEGQDPGPYLATPSFQSHFSIHNGAPLCKLGAILRFSCVNGEFRDEQVLQLLWRIFTTYCGWLTEHNVFCEQQRCSLWRGEMLLVARRDAPLCHEQ